MGILLAAMLLGLIPAYIASKKGRSAFAWWLYGSALFFVALPHALLLKDPLQSGLRQGLIGGMRTCPFCAESIQESAIICRFCNRDLRNLPPEVAAKEQARIRQAQHAKESEAERASNTRLGCLVLVGIFGLLVAVASYYSNDTRTNRESISSTTQPPDGFRNFKWGSSPSPSLKKFSGPTSEGVTMYRPATSKALSPMFEAPVAEEAYLFSHGKLFSGSAWFDGRPNFEKVKAALFRAYGQPSFTNEKLNLWKWKWQDKRIEVQLTYQPKFSRTEVTLINDSF